MRSIDVMLSRPGLYVVVGHSVIGAIEVDEEGKCFQLELKSGAFARDGELRPGGWFIENIASILGPFARTARAEQRKTA